jgi:hypothetical protein
MKRAETLLTHIREVLGLHLSQDTARTTIFRGFPQSFQVNSTRLIRLFHDRYLQNHPTMFILRISRRDYEQHGLRGCNIVYFEEIPTFRWNIQRA